MAIKNLYFMLSDFRDSKKLCAEHKLFAQDMPTPEWVLLYMRCVLAQKRKKNGAGKMNLFGFRAIVLVDLERASVEQYVAKQMKRLDELIHSKYIPTLCQVFAIPPPTYPQDKDLDFIEQHAMFVIALGKVDMLNDSRLYKTIIDRTVAKITARKNTLMRRVLKAACLDEKESLFAIVSGLRKLPPTVEVQYVLKYATRAMYKPLHIFADAQNMREFVSDKPPAWVPVLHEAILAYKILDGECIAGQSYVNTTAGYTLMTKVHLTHGKTVEMYAQERVSILQELVERKVLPLLLEFHHLPPLQDYDDVNEVKCVLEECRKMTIVKDSVLFNLVIGHLERHVSSSEKSI